MTKSDQHAQLFEFAVKSSADLIAVVDQERRFIFANQAWLTAFDYRLDEVLGRSAPDLTRSPDLTEEEARRIGAGDWTGELPALRRDGSELILNVTTSLIRDLDGQVVGCLTVSRDVTLARRRDERSQLLARAVESSDDAMSIIGPDERFTFVNQAWTRLYGYSAEEAVGRPSDLVQSPNEDPQTVARARMSDWSGEVRVVRKDGAERLIGLTTSLVHNNQGRLIGRLGVSRDVTDLRRMEDRLRALALAVDASSDLISIRDSAGRFTFVNEAWQRAMGYRVHEVIGKTDADLEWFGFSPAEYQAQRLEGEEWSGAFLARRKDGSSLPVHVASASVRGEGGAAVGRISVSRDLTEHERMAHALREMESRMWFALESAGVGVWDVDLQTGMVFCSPTCEIMHGLEAATFGRSFEVLLATVHPEDRPSFQRDMEQAMSHGGETTVDYRTRWADGTVRRMRATARFVRGETGTPIRGAGIVRDFTERQLLEDQLRQSQRMEAVGQLAGGIAHDFNNLLTAIQGFSELLSASLDPADPRSADIHEIQRATERATELTRQLLSFSRRQVLEPRVIRPRVVTSSLVPMLQRLLGEQVDLRTTLFDEARVKVDKGQLEQVLVNICVNARDAMPHGGCLNIETADVLIGEAEARLHVGLRPGPYVSISIADTGGGMDEHTQQRVFEPFFTTKSPGRGTGLGLSTVYGIVKQSQGYISVSSQVGQGTTLRVYLPQTDEAAEEDVRAAARPPEPSRASKVLIVEDNTAVRQLAHRILAQHGYVVHSEERPQAALAFAEQHRGTIDLVLSDVVLPDMSGPAMTKQLRPLLHPSGKILYMSGFPNPSGLAATDQDGAVVDGPFLQKPFTSARLLEAVGALLAS